MNLFVTASALTILATDVASGLAFFAKPLPHSNMTIYMPFGVYYSASTGITDTCAGYIYESSGVKCEDIGNAADGDVTGHNGLIVGSPTWHTGKYDQRSGTTWDDWLYKKLPRLGF